MNRVRMMVSMAAVAIGGASAFGIGASVSSKPSLMSRSDYESMRVIVHLDGQEAFAACDAQRLAARQLCQAEARAREEVLLADLEMRYRGTFSAARDARFTKIRAKYDVDRSRCFAFAGVKRDNCIVAAHADRARSLMAIKAEG